MRAWVYGRVSTRKASQEHSPERQLFEGKAFAAAREWQVIGEGYDRISGKAFRTRPEWERLMAALRSRRVDRVIVTDLDRVGRASVRSMLEEVEAIHGLGASLVVLRLGGEPVDLGSPMGRLAFVMLAAIAEFFRGNLREKIADGLADARRRGAVLGRPSKLGEMVVATARAMRLQGASWGEVARMVAEAGMGEHPPQSLRSAVERATQKVLPAVAPNPA